MQPLNQDLIFIVDDDASVREALAWLLRLRRLASEHFGSADEFESYLARRGLPIEPHCLLLDVHMPGKSGLELFDRLAELCLLDTMPVIFLTGHADVPTAVEMVKRGAFDFCEKPFSDNALVDCIERALGASLRAIRLRERLATLPRQIAELSERERDVVQLITRCPVRDQPRGRSPT